MAIKRYWETIEYSEYIAVIKERDELKARLAESESGAQKFRSESFFADKRLAVEQKSVDELTAWKAKYIKWAHEVLEYPHSRERIAERLILIRDLAGEKVEENEDDA